MQPVPRIILSAGILQGTLGQRTYGSMALRPTDIGCYRYTKKLYQMTHYFVQPQYISELDYYEIIAILNTRISELCWSCMSVGSYSLDYVRIVLGQVRLNSTVKLGWVTQPLRRLGWCKLDSVRKSALKLTHTKQTLRGRHNLTVNILPQYQRLLKYCLTVRQATTPVWLPEHNFH